MTPTLKTAGKWHPKRSRRAGRLVPSQTSPFAGANWKERASAYSGRYDGVVGRERRAVSRPIEENVWNQDRFLPPLAAKR